MAEPFPEAAFPVSRLFCAKERLNEASIAEASFPQFNRTLTFTMVEELHNVLSLVRVGVSMLLVISTISSVLWSSISKL
jgi:hypothetical protein